MIAERDRRAIRGRGAGFSGATDAARLSYTIYRGHNRRSRETRYVAVRDAGGRASCHKLASDCKVLAFAEAQPLPIGELRGVRQKAGLTLAITHSVIGREEPIPPERGASGTTRPSARRVLASSASAS